MANDIIVDVYEPDYFKDGLKNAGLLHSVSPIPTGDYVWLGSGGQSVAIERKEISDLLNSFSNGRLTDQLSRLVAQYSWPILMIEGFLGQNHDGTVKISNGVKSGFLSRNFRFSTIQLILLEAQLSGVFIVWSTSKYTSIHMIEALYDFSMKMEHSLLNKRSRPFQLGTKVDEQIFLLMGLPGFGESAARALITEFGTPFSALGGIIVSPERVRTIKGIGEQKIKRAQQVLVGSPASEKDNAND